MVELQQLQGKCTRLRQLTLNDAPAVHAMWGNEDVMRYWDTSPSPSVEETQRRLERTLKIGADWMGLWCVMPMEVDQVIGSVSYHHREPWYQRLEIGFMLDRSHWGRGLMSDAVAILLAYCFDTLSAHRAEATSHPDNRASIRLLERLGFQQESGILRQRVKVAGQFKDQLMFSLLEPEWRSKPG